MEEFEPLMKQGKLPEAEAVLDRAIEHLRAKTVEKPRDLAPRSARGSGASQ